jgi:hypothetical protein
VFKVADQTETSSDLQDELKEVWDDLKDVDLEGVQESFENLVNRIQTVTGEKREEIQEKLQDIADRLDISFGS